MGCELLVRTNANRERIACRRYTRRALERAAAERKR
jgi:hypothetical protein